MLYSSTKWFGKEFWFFSSAELEQNYEVPSVFSSTKWFEMEFRALLSSQNGSEWNYEVPTAFLYYEIVRYGIWAFFYLPRNGSEQNSDRFPFRKTGGMRTKWIKISDCSAEYFFLQKMAALNVQFLLRLYKTEVFLTIERTWLSVIKRRVVGTVPISGKIKYVLCPWIWATSRLGQ